MSETNKANTVAFHTKMRTESRADPLDSSILTGKPAYAANRAAAQDAMLATVGYLRQARTWNAPRATVAGHRLTNPNMTLEQPHLPKEPPYF
jgi:hypothetical protein